MDIIPSAPPEEPEAPPPEEVSFRTKIGNHVVLQAVVSGERYAKKQISAKLPNKNPFNELIKASITRWICLFWYQIYFVSSILHFGFFGQNIWIATCMIAKASLLNAAYIGYMVCLPLTKNKPYYRRLVILEQYVAWMILTSSTHIGMVLTMKNIFIFPNAIFYGFNLSSIILISGMTLWNLIAHEYHFYILLRQKDESITLLEEKYQS
jgi:hypothetical protein